MGQKHVRFQVREEGRGSSDRFLDLRIRDEKFEHPNCGKKRFFGNDSEETIPYPSSLSEVYEDSEDIPPRKVKILKTKSLPRNSKKFKQKQKKFDFHEFLQTKSFKENHVHFHNPPKQRRTKSFKQKVKDFDKNESRFSLLSKNSIKLYTDLSLSVKQPRSRALSTISTFRSVRSCFYTEDY